MFLFHFKHTDTFKSYPKQEPLLLESNPTCVTLFGLNSKQDTRISLKYKSIYFSTASYNLSVLEGERLNESPFKSSEEILICLGRNVSQTGITVIK